MATARVNRGMIRYLQLVLDLSRAAGASSDGLLRRAGRRAGSHALGGGSRWGTWGATASVREGIPPPLAKCGLPCWKAHEATADAMEP